MTSELPLDPVNVEVLHSAVEAFRRREITYRDMLDDLPVAIYTTDAEGRLTYFNQACVELAGRQPSLGDDCWSVIWKLYTAEGAPLPHAESPTAIAVRERRSVPGVELIAERPDGSRSIICPHPTPLLDPAGECLGAVTMIIDVTDQKMEQERALLLAREVDHRSTNLLTVVQSIVRLTKGGSVEQYRAAIESRLTALARANRLVAEARWQNVTLDSLVEVELGPFADRRVEVTGTRIELSPQSAQSLGMLIHELCTNAVKYGALSSDSGRVRIGWAVDDNGVLKLDWKEFADRPITEPRHKNVGNAVILGAVRQLRGEFFREWNPDGLRCTFLCSVERLSSLGLKPNPLPA
jgi:PAS domain S-box-containing protein